MSDPRKTTTVPRICAVRTRKNLDAAYQRAKERHDYQAVEHIALLLKGQR